MLYDTVGKNYHMIEHQPKDFKDVSQDDQVVVKHVLSHIQLQRVPFTKLDFLLWASQLLKFREGNDEILHFCHPSCSQFFCSRDATRTLRLHMTFCTSVLLEMLRQQLYEIKKPLIWSL